jgi:putative ABC transport system permease protein
MGVFGTERPLTIEDALALERLPYARAVVPFVQGNAEVEFGNRRRRTTIYGAGPAMPEAFKMDVSIGRFLPADDPTAPRAFAVLGSKMRSELFGERNPLGQLITISGSRFRIVGVMESKGTVLGFDLDDTVYIPAARAMSLFNVEGLIEIDVMYDRGHADRQPWSTASAAPWSRAMAATTSPSPPSSRCWTCSAASSTC